MSKKTRNLVEVVLFAVVLFGMFVLCLCKPTTEYSFSERRILSKFGQLSVSTLASGEYTGSFESAALDQFPFRDAFRTVKAIAVLNIFDQSDYNGLYIEDGYISKLEYPYQESMLNYACSKFSYLYETYLANSNCQVYFSLVPDKNCFLATDSNRLSLDYTDFFAQLQNKLPQMNYIDIFPLLSIEDFYQTDTHWRQECVTDVAQAIADEMGTQLDEDYTMHTATDSFYGVYCGQIALPVRPETLNYLTSDAIDSAIVKLYGSDNTSSVYNLEKAVGRDGYEMFLDGTVPLMTIENPLCQEKKELVVFRDSFGSSLVPLLISGYSKITVVDTRYISPVLLGDLVEFENCDVLFLYCTLLLNNSLALK